MWWGLLAKQVSQNEQDICRTLGQATHVIGIPGTAEGHVQTHAVALRDQPALEIPAYAVQHLELEGISRDLSLGGVSLSGGNHIFVVGRNSRVRTTVEQQL